MREPVRRSRRGLSILAIVLIYLASTLLTVRGTAHAGGTAIITVVDARTGVLQLSGSGYAPNQPLYLTIAGATLADPNFITRYVTVITTGTGSFAMALNLGEFLCGSVLRFIVSSDQDVWAESAPVLAQCPSTSPTIAITGISSGLIGISGTGFSIKESVGITVTSQLSGNYMTTSALSDMTGAFSATVPLGPIGCGERIVAYAVGAAGSNVQTPSFLYTCVFPPAPPPTPPPGAPAAPAGNASKPLPVAHNAYLSIANSPSVVSFHQVEKVRINTGTAHARVTVRLMALGMALASYTLTADAHGVAVLSYKVPMQLKHGQSLGVHYTVSYSVGARVLREAGSFTIAACMLGR